MAYVLQNLHWFGLLIGALVFVHELGHFVVAKVCGVKVLRFSLGFGPKLISFRHGETEYCISALPLGGYVKMLGESPGAVIPAEERDRAFLNRPVWQRAAVVVAGPAFNFLLAYLVYAVMFTGTHSFGDTKLGVVSRGDPGWEAGLRPGDRITSVGGEPVTRWEELREAIGTRPGEAVALTFERDGAHHTVTIHPESYEERDLFNEVVTRGRIGVSLQYIEPVLAVIDRESPAAVAGLATGDRIAEVNGAPVEAWHELRAAVAATPGAEPVHLLVRRGAEEIRVALEPGEPVSGLDPALFSAADTSSGYTGLFNKDTVIHEVDADTPAELAGLEVGDRLLRLAIQKPDGTTDVRPIGVWGIDLAAFSGVDARSEFTLTFQRGREVLVRSFELEEREEKDDLKNLHKRYVFGARNDAAVLGTYLFERHVGLLEALGEAAVRTAEDATLTGKGVAMIFQGRLPLNTIGGPIMLFVIAEKSAKRGWEHFLRIMAIISVNLGLINLFPVPVLDGGHLVFFGIEAVRRRPPSLRTREIANVVGLIILLMLMVVAITNDTFRHILD